MKQTMNLTMSTTQQKLHIQAWIEAVKKYWSHHANIDPMPILTLISVLLIIRLLCPGRFQSKSLYLGQKLLSNNKKKKTKPKENTTAIVFH